MQLLQKHVLKKLKGYHITAVAWHPNVGRDEQTTKEILVGTADGLVFETEIDTKQQARYWKQVSVPCAHVLLLLCVCVCVCVWGKWGYPCKVCRLRWVEQVGEMTTGTLRGFYCVHHGVLSPALPPLFMFIHVQCPL